MKMMGQSRDKPVIVPWDNPVIVPDNCVKILFFLRSLVYSGKLDLRIGTGRGGHFVNLFSAPPPVHMIFLVKSAISSVPVIFFPIKVFRGTRYWYANCSSLFIGFSGPHSGDVLGTCREHLHCI